MAVMIRNGDDDDDDGDDADGDSDGDGDDDSYVMVMMVIGMVIVMGKVMIVFVRTLRPAECANAPTRPTWAAQNASSPHLLGDLLGDLHITGVDLDTAGLNRQG